MSFTAAVRVLVVRVQHVRRHQMCKIKPSHTKCSGEQLQHVLQGRRDVKSIPAPRETVKLNTGKEIARVVQGRGRPPAELLTEIAGRVLLCRPCCLAWGWPESIGLAPVGKNIFSPKCLCLVITQNSEVTRSVITVRFVW